MTEPCGIATSLYFYSRPRVRGDADLPPMAERYIQFLLVPLREGRRGLGRYDWGVHVISTPAPA